MLKIGGQEMKTIFRLTLKAAARDPFLLFWSIILPIGGTIGLGKLIKSPEYPLHILIGMVATSILFYSFMTTSYTILAQRRRGVYNLLRVTPMSLWKYICSTSGAWALTSILCGIIVLMSGIVVFHINVKAISIFTTIPIVLIATIGYVFFSFFIAGLSRTEGNLSIITNIFSIPLLFCSNAFYSLDGAPKWIQSISRFNPFQWFINGLSSSLSLDLWGYFINILLLLIACAVALVLALRTFKYSD